MRAWPILAALVAASLSQTAMCAGAPQSTATPAGAGGFIIYSTQRSGPVMQFVKEAEPADLAAYEEAKDKAFQEALNRHDKKYPPTAARRAGESVPPPRPDRASFAFMPLGRFLTTQVYYGQRFDAGPDAKKIYMHPVKPGTYALYGPIIADDLYGTWGTCLCLGTLKFDVKAGEVVDIGLIESLDGIHATKTSRWIKGPGWDLPEGKTTFLLQPDVSWATPDNPKFAGLKLVRAKLRPAGQFPNWLGLGIDRITAIPGVMAYDGDRMIDLTK